jgi:hypothetical protein
MITVPPPPIILEATNTGLQFVPPVVKAARMKEDCVSDFLLSDPSKLAQRRIFFLQA